MSLSRLYLRFGYSKGDVSCNFSGGDEAWAGARLWTWTRSGLAIAPFQIVYIHALSRAHRTETDSSLKSSSACLKSPVPYICPLLPPLLSSLPPPPAPARSQSFAVLPLAPLSALLDFIHNGPRGPDSFIFALGYLVMDRKRSSRSHSPLHKRPKLSHNATPSQPPPTADPGGTSKSGAGPCTENLASGLLSDENVNRLRQEYANSQPFKYARVETLFQDDLLRRVKDECLSHLSFTEKETDIYRVSAPVYAVSDPDALPLRVLPTVSPPEDGREPSILFFSRADGHPSQLRS